MASARTGICEEDARKIVNATVAGLIEMLGNGERVLLRELGYFRFTKRKARLYNAPYAPNETIEVPPHTALRFIPSEKLRKRVAKLKV